MSDVTQATPAPHNRRMRFALLASLAVNVLLIGLMAGAFYHKHRHGGPRAGGKQSSLTAFAKTLPPDRRKVVTDFVEQRRQALKPLRSELTAARKAASDALVAAPFDQDKLKAALNRSIETEGRLETAAMAIFAESTALLTEAERAALHKWREERKGWRWRRKPKADDAQSVAPPPPAPTP